MSASEHHLPIRLLMAMHRKPVLFERKYRPERPAAAPQMPVEPLQSNSEGMVRFCVPGQPMGKPRMTQRDTWKKRPCVVAYRAWADKARAAAGKLPANPVDVSWVARFAMPESWSRKKKALMCGVFHRTKPDRDNVDKAVLDALFKNDSGIATGKLEKYWCLDGDEGITVTVTQHP